MKHTKQYNVMIFAVLILAAGTVYKVPYLKSVFYDQMVSGLSISHTQIGILSSAYAGSKMLMYIPCGIFADRINTKRVLVFSLVGESILTAILATLPAMPIFDGVPGDVCICEYFFLDQLY